VPDGLDAGNQDVGSTAQGVSAGTPALTERIEGEPDADDPADRVTEVWYGCALHGMGMDPR